MKGIFMNTREFYYLITIDNLGSLSSASKALDISQPALSKFLAKCENLFGFPLFIRYQRQLIPTSIGRYVVLCAHKILDEKNRMLLTMQKVTGGGKNRIKLATAPHRGAIIYSKIYNEFSRRFPDTSIELTELLASEQPKAISSGEVDIALGSGETSKDVRDLPIAHEELLVSIPISHPLAQNKEINLIDLKDTPFVLQSKKHSIRVLSDKLFKEAGFEPLIAFESDDVLLIDSMLHQAVGVGLVSQSHVTPCNEISYIKLNPPVYQQLHIRYALNHTLSDSENFLASLLIKERLSDSRYEAIHSLETDELLRSAEELNSTEISINSSNSNLFQSNSLSFKNINFDTKVLEYILGIIDEKSLTSAAEKFFLAQPALSRHLRNIEQLISMDLFTRDYNQLQPTNAGKIFANHVRNILHTEKEMFSYISSYQTGRSGKFYIYCDPSISELIRPDLLEEFNEKYPDIELIIRDSERESTIDSLLNSSIDIGLYFTCNPTNHLLNTKIIKMTELVYFSDDFKDQEPIGSNNKSHKFDYRKVMFAPKNTTFRIDQERLYSLYFSEYPSIVCEASIPLLQKLIGISNADTILPLHLIEEKHQYSYLSFDPPQKYYFVIGTHIGRKLPNFSNDVIALIEKSCNKFFAE